MRRNLKLFWFIIVILFCFLIFNSPRVYAQKGEVNSCLACHEDQKKEFEESIHAKRGLECVSCHGGNPQEMELEEAMSPKAGFTGKPDKREMVKLCASCHSDVEKMKQYGLRTDQYKLYVTSYHGKALFKNNDQNVAGCIDCHHNHLILPPSDPRSSVHKKNIPKTCSKCHSSKKLMSKYGLPPNQYEEYIKSVHGIALLERGNLAAPECARCHGVHGATPPGVTEVVNVCGQCHINTLDYINNSPHKNEVACSYCHNNHDIQIPTHDMFNTICLECHEKDSEAFQTGQIIKKLILETTNVRKEAIKKLEEARKKGIEVEEEQSQLEKVKTNIIQVIPIQHTLSLEKVEEYMKTAKSIASDVISSIDEKFNVLKRRRLALIIFWIVLLIIITIFYLKKRQADKSIGF
jgi:preprotein translocase subunit SecG